MLIYPFVGLLMFHVPEGAIVWYPHITYLQDNKSITTYVT